MEMSFRERFFGLPNPQGGSYAPSTIGAPYYTHATDYNVFKKSKEEKAEAQKIKSEHKGDMLRVHGKGNVRRRLNPSPWSK